MWSMVGPLDGRGGVFKATLQYATEMDWIKLFKIMFFNSTSFIYMLDGVQNDRDTEKNTCEIIRIPK